MSRTFLIIVILALLTPGLAWASSLEEAAERVARQHDARVLSAQTEDQGGEAVHVIRILTRDGVVRTVREPASGPASGARPEPRSRGGRQPPPERSAPPRSRHDPRWSAPPRSQERGDGERPRQFREAPRENYRDRSRGQPQPRLLPPREEQQEGRQRFREPEEGERPRQRRRSRDDGDNGRRRR